MPTCQNCGSHVSGEAIRVLYPHGTSDPADCIRCPDVSKVGFTPRGVER